MSTDAEDGAEDQQRVADTEGAQTSAKTMSVATLAERIHQQLPQTQCTRCGYPDCAAYAEAVASGECGINRCLPGDVATIARLASLTGEAVVPLEPSLGEWAPRSLAYIDSDWCIGCMLCIKACPVDAIVGAPKHMHVVIADLCTGCELCVEPCPVDCIEMQVDPVGPRDADEWLEQRAQEALARYKARGARLARASVRRRAKLLGSADERRREVAAAIARTKRKRLFNIEIR